MDPHLDEALELCIEKIHDHRGVLLRLLLLDGLGGNVIRGDCAMIQLAMP